MKWKTSKPSQSQNDKEQKKVMDSTVDTLSSELQHEKQKNHIPGKAILGKL
jgi:hypothetical protein